MYFDWRLIGMTRGVRGRVLLAALVGLAAVPVAMWRLTLTGQTMAQAFSGTPFDALIPVLAFIATLIVLRALLQLARDEIANATAALMKARVRGLLYEHVLQLGPGHFDQRRTGDAVLSLVDGVEQLDTFFGQYLPQLIVAGLTPVLIFAFMAFLDLPTAVIFLVFALATLVAPAAFHRWNSRASVGFRRAQSTTAADFLDSIQGLATLKAFGQSRQRGLELAERARHLYRTTMWVLAVNIGTGGITMLGISAGAAVALAWGAVRVESGELPLSTLLVVLLLGVEVFRPLRDLVQLYHGSMLAVAATRGMYQLLDTIPEVQSPAAAVAPDRLRPVVRFEHVSFGYEGGRRPAVADVSFELQPGETLGVVGPSGAGKSTLVNLLLRFVDPRQGRVLLDGHDLRELGIEHLRRQVAVVAQDTYLFYGSVAENLRVARTDASQAELEAACRAANAHEFVVNLPRGYDTLIGERGVRLSGGQRQRLAIARALLKDAPILVLDEALSSVDAENESIIQQALERLQQGRTTLVIAHRLSSVANADRIIVLERGRLVEEGAPAELMQREGGVYQRLMSAQRARLDDALLTDDSIADANSPQQSHDTSLGRTTFASSLPSSAPTDGVSPRGSAHSSDSAAADGAPLHTSLQSSASAEAHGTPWRASVQSNSGVRESAPWPASVALHAGGGSGHSRSDSHSHASAIASPALASSSLPANLVWRRLLKLVRPWWWEIALVFLLGPLQAGLQVGLGVMSALLVAQVVLRADLTPWLVGLAILVPAAAVFRWMDSWISHDLAYRLLAELRIRLYQLLDPLAPAYLVRRRSGDLVSALLGDVELIELFYAHTISPLFVAILVPGSVLIVLAVLAPPLALVLVPFVVGVALTPLLASRQSAQLGSALRETTGEVTAHAVDSVQGLRTIVAFSHGKVRGVEIADRSLQLGELKRRFLRWQAVQNAVIEALMGLGALAVLTAGARLVADGQLARTALPLATLLAASSFQPVITIVTVFKELHQTVSAARRFFAVEDEPVAVVDGPRSLADVGMSLSDRVANVGDAASAGSSTPVRAASDAAGTRVSSTATAGAHTPEVGAPTSTGKPVAAASAGASMPVVSAAATGTDTLEAAASVSTGTPVAAASTAQIVSASVNFESVTFAYGRAERAGLRDVTFDIPAGKTVALVGRSGAGKTTAAHLLLRFWDPQTGRIAVDGLDVRELKLDDLRGLIALVAQDTYLFNASLRENIRLGRPRAADAEVLQAAVAANVDEFAQALPDGYDTSVGERGMQLSGGQRQRVSIARALLKNAPILVLDEATSHLDAVSESEVRQALNRLSRGRTTLVIAHRLSTIREADQIVVLDEGRVVERGRHAELLALDGLYSHLIASQLGAGARQPEPRSAVPAD